MRTTIILIAMVAIAQVIFAESLLEKGSIEYGGSVSFMRRTYDDENRSWSYDHKVTTWDAVPQFGYFVRDGLSIGFDILFSHVTNEWQYQNPPLGDDKITDSQLAIGPRITYYFKPSEKHTPFVALGGRIGMGVYENKHSGSLISKSDISQTDFHIGLGILNTVNRFVAITTSLTYTVEDFHYELEHPGTTIVGEPVSDASGNRLTLDVGFKLFKPPSNK